MCLSLYENIDILTQICFGSSPYDITRLSWIRTFRAQGGPEPKDQIFPVIDFHDDVSHIYVISSFTSVFKLRATLSVDGHHILSLWGWVSVHTTKGYNLCQVSDTVRNYSYDCMMVYGNPLRVLGYLLRFSNILCEDGTWKNGRKYF
jgi:hypothetical protein